MQSGFKLACLACGVMELGDPSRLRVREPSNSNSGPSSSPASTPSALVGTKPGSVKRGLTSSPPAKSIKRARKSSALEGSTGVAIVKVELKDGDSSGRTAEEEVEDSEPISAEQGTWCRACLRVYGTDMHFLDAEQDMALLYPDGRGDFCKECNGVYRLYYRHSMTLSLFHRWLLQHRLSRKICFHISRACGFRTTPRPRGETIPLPPHDIFFLEW